MVEGFEQLTLPLPGADPEVREASGELVATLVRAADPTKREHRRAVLFVHGWNDYFFHTHVADFFAAQGFAFYALDLRRYGRSYRPGQFHGYTRKLEAYFAELDAARRVIAADHDGLVVMGHSTGGLVVSLWAAARPGVLDGVVLNSPWLDVHGPPQTASLVHRVMKPLARRRPTTVLPLPDIGSGRFVEMLHADNDGEWTFDRRWKSPTPVAIRLGWLRAVLKAQKRVAKGLRIDCPVFMATSTKSIFLARYSKRGLSGDNVLDVDKIAARAHKLGRRVTLVRIERGRHDLTLSEPAARTSFFSQLALWLRAYLPDERAGGGDSPLAVTSAEQHRVHQ